MVNPARIIALASLCLAACLSGENPKPPPPGPGDAGPTCTPQSCASLALRCGQVDDGCGGELDCGPCSDACVRLTCAQAQVTCGTAPDGCGGTLSCGACCTPSSCEAQGKN